jgi:signal transduction histidine kinase/ActR/RegA family two-component response regulator
VNAHRDEGHHEEQLEPLLDWSDLLTAENPADFLSGLGHALFPHVSELTLKNVEGGGSETIARWQEGAPSGTPPHQVEIGGGPRWRLSIRFVESAPQWILIERALLAIEAWRSASQGLAAERGRVEARTRELDLIQELGRGAAEARDLDALFRYAIDLLQNAEDIDVAVSAYSVGTRRTLLALESRAVEASTRSELLLQATRLLGWADADIPQPRVDQLRGFDAERDELREWQESSLVVLPVLRGERMAACLALLPSRPAEEGSLRLCFAVANQLSLHLDRILTVQEAEADRFRSVLESMPQAVAVLDGSLRLVQANPAAAELFSGFDWPLDDTLEPALRELGMGESLDALRRGERDTDQREVQVEDDRTLALSVSRLMDDSAGEPGVVLVVSDMSQTRRMQMQLAHAEKMSSLGRMISGITHELNNPLTSIMGYAQLLRAQMPDGKVAERADMLESEARRCQKIVKNLLSFARRREVKHGTLSLNEVIESVVSLMRYQLRVDSIDVSADLFSDLPALRGDHHQLQQVLVNLLTNAQQAIRSQAESGTISVCTRLDHGRAILEVSDDGPGISIDARGKIFDPFFTTKPEGQGTGLGLSLVYGILRDHGGAIEALQDVPVGACFRVSLPVPVRTGRRAESRGQRLAPVEVPPATVLVVDDEEPIARMICESLGERGHKATYAPNAGAALDEARLQPFDLVIADLRMPGMSGAALFEILADRYPRLAGRLLLTTGDTSGDSVDDVSERTGCAVLTKPFDVEALHHAVRERLLSES